MTLAVVRVRGTLRVKPDIKETLMLLSLNRVNHCVVIPETPEFKGMLQKVKDYVTWGEVEQGYPCRNDTAEGSDRWWFSTDR